MNKWVHNYLQGGVSQAKETTSAKALVWRHGWQVCSPKMKTMWPQHNGGGANGQKVNSGEVRGQIVNNHIAMLGVMFCAPPPPAFAPKGYVETLITSTTECDLI